MNESPSLHASTVESLSARVEERVVGPCRVLMLKTPVQAVVSWLRERNPGLDVIEEGEWEKITFRRPKSVAPRSRGTDGSSPGGEFRGAANHS